ncbi:ATP-dependent DNA helicase RecG [Pinirhizobacter soli]|uniref:ATP-dependent DNA helicase RecG n=1 Tax=Pinirhizobacter soli TaxID=2786953 RepID=UPI002029DF4D|nr:ATP-dependent DNA helicase RecG [Pinirhizobacter soli]
MPARTTTPVPVANPGVAPVSMLPGVGPALAQSLGRIGLNTVQDLWFHLPLRYEDRTTIAAIGDLHHGEQVQFEGVVTNVERGFRFRPQLKVALADDNGDAIVLRFFHFHRSQVEQLKVGTRLLCFGEVRQVGFGLEVIHPQYTRVESDIELAVEERLTPIYPTGEGLGPKRLASVIGKALALLPTDDSIELLPRALLEPLQMAPLRDALMYVHRPPPDTDLLRLEQGRHPMQRRLAFEELLTQHLTLRRMRAQVKARRAPKLGRGRVLAERLLASLPFSLTGAQQRVAGEIADDLKRGHPMLRLVQGDVGSGKTIVAALAALTAVESGYQVALMAPTELLAEQHLRNFRAWLEPLGLEVQWLAGKVQGRARKAALERTAGGAHVVVGTHALMQEGVVFDKLGLVIVDEQHRFGVHQRLALRDKGAEGDMVPHQLVLTATPIPRTLAMSAYADLDVSSIDELPPGRTPVVTVAVSSARREEVIERIRVACAEGRQVYWVCTLIEESEQLNAQAAEVAHADLTAALVGVTVALIHGRMKPKEKQATMDAFKAGSIAVLVATTVIEVGVDVPNASLMVIENAERLGLAQLHQLRGRVGRGSVLSNCVLLYRTPLSLLARERLQVMRQTSDGFRIAEKDLELRGPGEVLGTRQTGQLQFRIADLARDADMLPTVHEVGEQLLEGYPALAERLVTRWVGDAARYVHA